MGKRDFGFGESKLGMSLASLQNDVLPAAYVAALWLLIVTYDGYRLNHQINDIPRILEIHAHPGSTASATILPQNDPVLGAAPHLPAQALILLFTYDEISVGSRCG
jgi:hypothetical protein